MKKGNRAIAIFMAFILLAANLNLTIGAEETVSVEDARETELPVRDEAEEQFSDVPKEPFAMQTEEADTLAEPEEEETVTEEGEAAGESESDVETSEVSESAETDGAEEETEGISDVEETEKPAMDETDEATDAEKEEKETETEERTAWADYVELSGDCTLKGADVQGKAADEESEAIIALCEYAGVSAEDAALVSDALFHVPMEVSASEVEGLSLQWVAKDIAQVNYLLSGTTDYEPGEVQIVLSSVGFLTESGEKTGTVLIPYGKMPSVSADFAWEVKNGVCVLTNTRTLLARTRGFIQLALQSVPEEMAASCEMENLFAEVILTHRSGVQVRKRSNALEAAVELEKKGGEAKRLSTVSLLSIADDSVSRSADGSNIEAITAKWITQDTEDNGDSALLYIKPNGNTDQTVKLQINYALSGEYDYAPGDVTITVPAYIIRDRDGKDAGTFIIPYGQEPSVTGDFNWKLTLGDDGEYYYVLTNTKTMSAASKGYIQFAIDELVVDTLVDMEISNEFTAYIEVATHLGNVIGLESNALTVQFDTEARIDNTTKRRYGEPTVVSANRIPEEQRIEGEEQYLLVKWYVFGSITANTKYTLDILDEKTDSYEGFILNASSEDGQTDEKTLYAGTRDGMTSWYYYTTAYPMSQFEPNTKYTFVNTATLTVTEWDPENGDDPQLVTCQTDKAQAVWSYSEPKFEAPTGHFNVFKNGNDGSGKNNYTHFAGSTSNYSDLHRGSNGYYGIYPSALNDLQDEEDVTISYTVNSVGYLMPWTYQDDGTELSARKISNYGVKPVTMVTMDTGLSVGETTLAVGEDYIFTAVEFPYIPYIYKGLPKNINEDGSFTANSAGDGTFSYTRDHDTSNIPDISLQIYRNGSWEDWAVAVWSGGSIVVTMKDGNVSDGISVPVPSDTESFRTIVVSTNAAIDYDVRPVVKLLQSSGKLSALVKAAFENSNEPRIAVCNDANMTAFSSENSHIVSIDRSGYDSLRGYTTETAVYPQKTATQSLADVDFDARTVTIHYAAQVEIRSAISDRETYLQAISDGRIAEETQGIWRDLLPRGVAPLLDTIKLRDGDCASSIYTIEDYRGSGRTLLVVEADLTPTVTTYQNGDSRYYEDLLTVSFDAIYGFDEITDFGSEIHNVIAYESGKDFLGTIEHYTGEPDTPYFDHNISTAKAFDTEEEKRWMADLDADSEAPNFVYAGAYTVLNILSAARTSLSKDVQTNGDGRWSSGVYYDDEETNARNVYTGGNYSYRLRMMSDADTVSKDMILFDSLENFYAGDGNDTIDIGAERWQGTLRRVDVSQLLSMGCAPVVYYSTASDLLLSDESDEKKANAINTELSNTELWVRADAYTGDLSDVKAIAIDASKKPDGTDFELQPLESVVVFVYMAAPSGDEAAGYIAADAHAYNNSYLLCTSIDVDTGVSDSDHFIRKDYTKVGLGEYSIQVRKCWDDENDRDGKRPESVTVHLYANGTDTGKSIEITDDGTGMWQGGFENIPFSDEDGKKIIYSIREDAVSGYSLRLSVSGETDYQITNIHTPERLDIEGEKRWEGEDSDVRPDYINVYLYANGKLKSYKTVRPDPDGRWAYAFTNLYRYEGGEEIAYAVLERQTDELKSYEVSYEDFDIINVYHPYGDLVVSKSVEQATSVSIDTEFYFTVTFSREKEDGEVEPIFEDFAYEVLSEDGTVLSEGTITNNGRITLKHSQSARIRELPEYIRYAVTEEPEDGFRLVRSANAQGVIQPNETQEAEFVNEYSASGQIILNAGKKLNNRIVNKNQFTFDLWDAEGNRVKVARNGAATKTEYREDGTLEYSEASAAFGALMYTQEDVGKTYTYTITERDAEKPGYSYDPAIITADVTITDNGDGTLNVTAVYKKEGEAVETAGFENTYHATGSTVITAWKDLQGRKLQAGEFTFELIDYETDEVLCTSTCAADGKVTFDEIAYDETDIGKAYYYYVREVSGSDETVIYDENSMYYSVTVLDNGDGTLTCAQGNVDTSEMFTPCPHCDGTGEGDDIITIEYTYGSGLASAMEWLYFIAVDEELLNDSDAQTASISIVSDNGRMLSSKNLDRSKYQGKQLFFFLQFFAIMANRDYKISAVIITAGGETTVYKLTQDYDAELYRKFIGRCSEKGYVYIDGAPGPIRYKGGICKVCDGSGIVRNENWEPTASTEDLPVFYNRLKDGTLTVAKHVTDAEGADPDQRFTFHILLSGDENEYTCSLKADETYSMSVPAGASYQVYEETPDGWVLAQESGSSGTIVTLTESQAVFNNRYAPDSTSIQFTGVKSMDGEAPEAGRFTFELFDTTNETDKDGLDALEPVQSVRVSDGGGIRFEPIIYDSAGTYTYAIREAIPDNTDGTIVYDTHVENITVEVADNGQGSLTASVTEGASHVTFANTTAPGSLKIRKSVDPSVITEANRDTEFVVRVSLYTGSGIPVSSQDYTIGINGEQIIENIPAGYLYTVEEIDVPAGWSMAGEALYFNETRKIQANTQDTVEIRNTYEAVGYASIQAYKALSGGIKDYIGDFSFTLYDTSSGEERFVQTVTNADIERAEVLYDDDGNSYENPWYGYSVVNFGQLQYTKEGTYTYVIREQSGDYEDILYDTDTMVVVTVTVTDNGNGTMDTEVSYKDGNRLFTNLRTGSLIVSKAVTGALGDKTKEFGFQLWLTGENLERSTVTYTKTYADGETTESGEVVLIDGRYEFTLAHNEEISFDGIIYGTTWQIAETDANQNGYTTTASGSAEAVKEESGVVSVTHQLENSVETAAFTNENNAAVPTKVTDTTLVWWVISSLIVAALLLIGRMLRRMRVPI